MMENNSLVVGLASPKEGGKDMVANIIREELCGTEARVYTLRFADPLKTMVSTLFGWDRSQLSDDIDFKEKPDPNWGGVTPRQAMQLIGTEMFRDGPLYHLHGINMWVDVMKNELRKRLSKFDRLVLIPDCRFNDEFLLIKNLGGIMVFMDPRPRLEKPVTAAEHASEWDMWNFNFYDHVIDTGGSMEKTEKEARVLAHLIEDRMGL